MDQKCYKTKIKKAGNDIQKRIHYNGEQWNNNNDDDDNK